jgi:hypothetical protein
MATRTSNEEDDKKLAEKKKVDIITVKSKLKPDAAGGNPVALAETHPDHPNGEVFVYGDKEFKVARTAAVSLALAQERIVEV